MRYKLPLIPHVSLFRRPNYADLDTHLLGRIVVLEAELADAREWIAELEAEVLEARSRGLIVTVTLGGC